MYYLYISVNSLVKAASSSGESASEDNSTDTAFTKDFVHFTTKDLSAVKKIVEDADDTFKLLVNSLCPAIFGHELVKGTVIPSNLLVVI
jgi:DNA helicase MCM8